MSEIDAKVNMSLDEIIKMENKKKRQKDKVGFRGVRATAKANMRRGPQGRRNVQKKNLMTWKRQGKVQTGYIKKKNTMFRSKSNMALNQTLQKSNLRNNFMNRRLNNGRVGLARSKSRSNLTFTPTKFLVQTKINGKRTNSMPNLRDPNSVHNRLGYQSPAQIAYRNRIKRAKQILMQNQKLNIQNNLRANQATKPLTTLQRGIELRQQTLLPQRLYGTSGLRSDIILRAQRRAQYEAKLMRLKASQMAPKQDIKVIYPPVQRANMNSWFTSMKTQNTGNINNLQQLSRGRSPYRQTLQTMQQQRAQSFNRQRRSRSRSRSRTRHRNITLTNHDLEDRTFSEVMYSLYRIGVTDKTLNERFSY